MGALSSKATAKATITNTCAVFAQTEIISLLAMGESIENIIAGLHASVASRIVAMTRRLGARPTIMITGGVAKNSGVVTALKVGSAVDVVLPAGIDPQLWERSEQHYRS
jgi:activator of 2-hydroxyglutaryl-CoA dehydratase